MKQFRCKHASIVEGHGQITSFYNLIAMWMFHKYLCQCCKSEYFPKRDFPTLQCFLILRESNQNQILSIFS